MGESSFFGSIHFLEVVLANLTSETLRVMVMLEFLTTKIRLFTVNFSVP